MDYFKFLFYIFYKDYLFWDQWEDRGDFNENKGFGPLIFLRINEDSNWNKLKDHFWTRVSYFDCRLKDILVKRDIFFY